jgi:hypothetical protein
MEHIQQNTCQSSMHYIDIVKVVRVFVVALESHVPTNMQFPLPSNQAGCWNCVYAGTQWFIYRVCI